jgi:deoxyguanosine kinase
MLISVEGCLGVGKSTLVRRVAERMPCTSVFEEVTANPFLLDFYRSPKQYAPHVQFTFLLLQERLFRTALELAKQPARRPSSLDEQEDRIDVSLTRVAAQAEGTSAVVCDFHPFKSKVFASMVLSPDMQTTLTHLYRDLRIPEPDLVVYLRADEQTILHRLRKRHDSYLEQIDLSYVVRVCHAYDTFFRQYPGRVITIDTTHIDYVQNPHEVSLLLQQIPLLFT